MEIRRPTLADAAGVAELLTARDAIDFGETRETTGDEVASWWRPELKRLAQETWVAFEEGRVVGYASVRPTGDVAAIDDESSVHPDARGRGIGSALVDEAEGLAIARRLPRVHLTVVNDDGRSLARERGYALVRHFWRMEIDLSDSEPVEPELPEGVAIRQYRPGADDQALHAMDQEAFGEHWEFVPTELDEWLGWRQEREDYVPALWQLAVAEGEVAGAALCFGERDRGWVLDLGVRKRWRGRGLGLALLHAGFRELRGGGYTKVGLEVDSANETGATRLYERAGMAVTRQYDTYEKRFAGE
ncbi:MAG TPA: GNAT family N-acetyltransferase [Gaiellaceae bacterium]|nr:GNAT family N-acetyltransferase [Gaiellaceae bacterium]